jgi:S-(hydroxymethyl)glutathione dehydrogenase/alcohol dehydrogenase
MMQDGIFNPKGFISHRVALQEVNETIEKMRSGEVIHALIHFD